MPKLKLPDIEKVTAIDIHTHAEEPCGMHGDDGYDDFQAQMADYFKSPHKHPPTVPETAAYYRSKNIAAVIFPVDAERETGFRRYKNEEMLEIASDHLDVLIPFVSIDPHKGKLGVREARKLIEGDEVLLVFQPLGTAPNVAIQKYLNGKKVPHLFIASGATRFGDPKNFAWTMGWQPNYQSEGRIYAKYILANHPNAKIGIFYQNDDLGRDYIAGLKSGLGDKAASMIVAEVSYELTDPTVDSQIVKLKAASEIGRAHV